MVKFAQISFTLPSSAYQYFFNISLQTVKTNDGDDFYSNITKCKFCTFRLHFERRQMPETTPGVERFRNSGTSYPAAIKHLVIWIIRFDFTAIMV